MAATDRLTGEGIAQALVSGRLAAGAIVHGGLDAPAETEINPVLSQMGLLEAAFRS